jgi:cytochrome P450
MQFDPLSSEFQRDPYPVYERLRAETPIFFHLPSKMWFVTTHADVTTLLRDRRLGRSIDHVLSREQRGLPPIPQKYAPFDKLSSHSMFDKEPPDHTRLRSLVHKAFTPRRVENLRVQIQAITDALLNRVQVNGRMDIIEDFATPLPVTVIAELLGVPDEDRHRLRPWSQDIVTMYELDHTEAQGSRAVQAAIEFSDYLRALAIERRQRPKDDLISALATIEEGGDRLTMDELISTCVLLLNAGHEATVNVIGNGMLALLHRPDELRKLRAEPTRVRTAIEEIMRFDTPLQLFRRWVLEDITYKGCDFRQGEEIALMFGSANRDETRFPHANELDVSRADNPHVSFSAGIHYCLGAPLARLELEIAVGTLLRRLPVLQLDGPEPEYRDTYVIRGLKALHVTF